MHPSANQTVVTHLAQKHSNIMHKAKASHPGKTGRQLNSQSGNIQGKGTSLVQTHKEHTTLSATSSQLGSQSASSPKAHEKPSPHP
ncbi:hypothetical protein FRX31_031613 [Thalictrum thalictroides]|uniref:Uncharacterized protein n=1 Tax=Thalictrum thalictroides TaxID=46969 RepID=A0A7J6V1X1_THATH|nr:hypothetical protein FRX31_031613 [Thalictrum thalictroides]